MTEEQTLRLSIDSTEFREALDEYAAVIAEQNERLTTLETEVRDLKTQMKLAAGFIKNGY